MSTTNQLVWTNEKPTKPGWYWYKYRQYEPRVVEIIQCLHGLKFPYWGNPVKIEDADGQFAGPIPEPDGIPALTKAVIDDVVKQCVAEITKQFLAGGINNAGPIHGPVANDIFRDLLTELASNEDIVAYDTAINVEMPNRAGFNADEWMRRVRAALKK